MMMEVMIGRRNGVRWLMGRSWVQVGRERVVLWYFLLALKNEKDISCHRPWSTMVLVDGFV